jgi:WD40 repeat protein
MHKLRPEDFRIGSKNKHIDAFSVNQKGFVVGGTNHGEIYLWKMNFGNLRQRKGDNYSHWINSFKLHKKAIHYVDFNSSGLILMTGSADGTSCLYDTSQLKDNYSSKDHKEDNKESKSYKNIEISEEK